jgi:hypothetical protein
MKEPHEKGVANHLDLQSCAGCRVKCRPRHRRARNRASKNAFRAPAECSRREGHTGGNDIASFPQARRSPRAVRTSRNGTRANRETAQTSIGTGWIRPASQKHNPVVHVGEESNSGIVPARLPNRAGGDIGRGGGGGKARDQGDSLPVAESGNQEYPSRGRITAGRGRGLPSA